MNRDTTERERSAGTATDRAETGNGSFERWRADTRTALADSERARVDVYVRSLLPPPGAKEGQTDLLETLHDLREDGIVGDVTVNVWGERICLCDTCRALDAVRAALDTVREFERWGEEYDASADSFFERSRRGSALTGHTYDGLTPPRVTAALYVDGILRGVFPSRFGDRPVSAHDFATALERMTDAPARVDAADRRNRIASPSSE